MALGASLVVVGYLGVVTLTFVGAPGLRDLEVPGLGEFARPAGSSDADVGPSPAGQDVPAVSVPVRFQAPSLRSSTHTGRPAPAHRPERPWTARPGDEDAAIRTSGGGVSAGRRWLTARFTV